VSVDHYENFPVASILCPPAMRPAIVAIYRYARTADDIADEGDESPAQRLADLAAYRAELLRESHRAESEPARWPQIFEPLRAVQREHDLPVALLNDLLSAFEQDVVKHDYADRGELLDYCRRSANPIGRLLLRLYRIDEPAALRQSDAICTALQLANFWQDLGVDTRRGRHYIPASDRAHHVDNLPAQLQAMVAWTRELMESGSPLVHRLPGRAGWELRLVLQGGLRILDKIEALRFDTRHQRPKLGMFDVVLMLWRALWMRPSSSRMARSTA
jgi:squalene synthase HpnC